MELHTPQTIRYVNSVLSHSSKNHFYGNARYKNRYPPQVNYWDNEISGVDDEVYLLNMELCMDPCTVDVKCGIYTI